MPIDFSKIKSLFVVEDENTASEKPKADEGRITINQPNTAGGQRASGGVSSNPGEVNPKFMEVLAGALEKANLPGVDYLEYRQSLKSLEKMPMDEQVRYQSAFAMAQAMGATPQKLTESANHYLGVLKTEHKKFEEALLNQTTERIGSRQDLLKNLDATIKQKAELIKKLTEEMELHRAEMQKLDLEIKDSIAKVEATKNDFSVSYQSLVSQITKDVESMGRFLK